MCFTITSPLRHQSISTGPQVDCMVKQENERRPQNLPPYSYASVSHGTKPHSTRCTCSVLKDDPCYECLDSLRAHNAFPRHWNYLFLKPAIKEDNFQAILHDKLTLQMLNSDHTPPVIPGVLACGLSGVGVQ